MILIDPGHTRKKGDPGSCFGLIMEGEITFSVAQKVMDRLNNRGVDACLSHTGSGLDRNSNNDINKRMGLIRTMKPAAVISIHTNSVKDPAAHGTETLYYDHTGEDLAQILQSEMINSFGLTDRGIKMDNIGVLRAAAGLSIPAALVEIGFISNQVERSFIISAAGQEKAAEAITTGILSYFNISIPSAWEQEQAAAAAWVKQQGISDGTRPGDMITRSEIFVMLHRFANN